MCRIAAVMLCRNGSWPCSDAAVATPQVIDDPQSDSLLLVMEHVQGGSLEQRLLSPPPHARWSLLPEPAILKAVTEICQVLTGASFGWTSLDLVMPSHHALLLASGRSCA